MTFEINIAEVDDHQHHLLINIEHLAETLDLIVIQSVPSSAIRSDLTGRLIKDDSTSLKVFGLMESQCG
jgi:hypothetical protein